ncbi:MAG: hypothetical protein IKM61_06270 [Eubacteriaceae bacterium]|nr:hypothetical protein [Eubacteriaceae bacterium]
MNKAKKRAAVKVVYLFTAVFIFFWSLWKYNLGVNKNFFFGQLAVIGIILLFFSIFTKMNRRLLAEKIDIALEENDYARAAVLMDEYISEEKVPEQTYLGRSFIALLQSDAETVESFLDEYAKDIQDADKYVMHLILAAIRAKKGDTVTANQMLEEKGFDFSSMLNKDFYLPLVDDIRDYIHTITLLSQQNRKEAEKIVKKREKHTLAGAYESIMNILWENISDGIIYVLPKAENNNEKKSGIGLGVRYIAFYILAALVLLVPSDFNFKDEYTSLSQLNDRINFLNEVVCAYGNDEVYYLKYYDFEGNYNDLVFEVNDGIYTVLTGEDRFEQFMKGRVDERDIKISLFGSVNKDSNVLVIEEITDLPPSQSAEYLGNRAFCMNLPPFSGKDMFNYTVFMGMYDGSLSDIVVDFDWGSVDIYDLQ